MRTGKQTRRDEVPNYATTADLKARYASTRDLAHVTHDEDTGVPSETVLTASLDYAETRIDSYLAKVYEVPIDETLDTSLANFLREFTLDLAMWHLAFRQNWISKAIEDAKNMAIEWLVAVGNGDVYLPTAKKLASTTTVGPVIVYGTGSDSEDRVFTRETAKSL